MVREGLALDQEYCLTFLEHPNYLVRWAAALSLGYIALFHKQLDVDRVLPALYKAQNDPFRGGRRSRHDFAEACHILRKSGRLDANTPHTGSPIAFLVLGIVLTSNFPWFLRIHHLSDGGTASEEVRTSSISCGDRI